MADAYFYKIGGNGKRYYKWDKTKKSGFVFVAKAKIPVKLLSGISEHKSQPKDSNDEESVSVKKYKKLVEKRLKLLTEIGLIDGELIDLMIIIEEEKKKNNQSAPKTSNSQTKPPPPKGPPPPKASNSQTKPPPPKGPPPPKASNSNPKHPPPKGSSPTKNKSTHPPKGSRPRVSPTKNKTRPPPQSSYFGGSSYSDPNFYNFFGFNSNSYGSGRFDYIPRPVPNTQRSIALEILLRYGIISKKDLDFEVEELKKTRRDNFRKWLLKNHPDKGGELSACQEVISAGKYMGWNN